MGRPGVGGITPWYVGSAHDVGSPLAFQQDPQIDGRMTKVYVSPVNGKPHVPLVCDPKAGDAAADPVWKVKHQGLIFIIA